MPSVFLSRGVAFSAPSALLTPPCASRGRRARGSRKSLVAVCRGFHVAGYRARRPLVSVLTIAVLGFAVTGVALRCWHPCLFTFRVSAGWRLVAGGVRGCVRVLYSASAENFWSHRTLACRQMFAWRRRSEWTEGHCSADHSTRTARGGELSSLSRHGV